MRSLIQNNLSPVKPGRFNSLTGIAEAVDDPQGEQGFRNFHIDGYPVRRGYLLEVVSEQMYSVEKYAKSRVLREFSNLQRQLEVPLIADTCTSLLGSESESVRALLAALALYGRSSETERSTTLGNQRVWHAVRALSASAEAAMRWRLELESLGGVMKAVFPEWKARWRDVRTQLPSNGEPSMAAEYLEAMNRLREHAIAGRDSPIDRLGVHVFVCFFTRNYLAHVGAGLPASASIHHVFAVESILRTVLIVWDHSRAADSIPSEPNR